MSAPTPLLGFRPGPTDHAESAEAIVIVDTAKKHKIPAGIHCAAPSWAREMIGIGYQLVTLGNDNSLMMGAARAIAATREGAAAPAQKPGSLY